MAQELWVEKYRPQTMDDYVFTNSSVRDWVEGWIQKKIIPNLILSGKPGVGKTSLARLLKVQVGIDDFDFLEINASRDRDIETIRSKVTDFASMMPYGEYRVVLLDEADYLPMASQAPLRGIIEAFSSTCRFILTVNYPHRLMDALLSRHQHIEIKSLPKESFKNRLETILKKENVGFENEVLDEYVKITWPDLRKGINTVETNSSNGNLSPLITNQFSTDEEKFEEAFGYIAAGQIRKGREIITPYISFGNIDKFFEFCYKHLDYFGKNDRAKDEAILCIRNSMVHVPSISDPEILASATLILLERIWENEV